MYVQTPHSNTSARYYGLASLVKVRYRFFHTRTSSPVRSCRARQARADQSQFAHRTTICFSASAIMVICCFASLCICCLLGLAACITQPQQGANPYFAPYLKPDELPDGALMPLFNEIWTVIGSGLSHPNFTKQVDLVATGIFSQYSFHGEAVGTEIGIAAPTYLDGNPGKPCFAAWCCLVHAA